MRGCGAAQALLCFTVLALFLPAMARLAVMSIDLGGEFMKIAIVKPGVPMEIVLNKESSRKTQTVVSFRDGDRTFANEAYNTAVRFPAKSFWFLTHIIGRTFDDPLVQHFQKRFPYFKDLIVKDEERGTVLFKEEDTGTLYSVEELLGMILEQAREYAQEFAEQTIKDAVITVPPYYNQAERRAILAAAEMVGINVLQLMNDNAAVALNYGVFRRKNFNTTAQYYMFYDMGTSSTVATIVSYQIVKTKEGTRVESNPQLTVKGVGYDRNLGGLEMTMRLRDHLAKVFNSKKKRNVKVEDNPRAMAKLLKEAERVKKVLSANTDHKAQVEGLLDGEDFGAMVTRAEYLDLIKDLLARVTKPVEDALKASEITMPEISEIILMGGGSRLPRVQELLMKFSGKSELGKSINTDEAAALGAVYQAAYLGKGFKVKTFHVRDANIFPITVEFEKQKSEDGSTDTKIIKRTLFGRMNPYPQKKVMTFNKHFNDFSFAVRYGDLDFLSEEEKKSFPPSLLANVSLAGIGDAIGKHTQGADYKGVKAHFRMDQSGILHLDKVESLFETQQAVEEEKKKDESTWSKIGSAFGGLFGSKDGAAEEGKAETTEEGAEPSQQGDNNQTETGSDRTGQAETGTDQSEQGQTGSEKSEEKKEKPDEKKKDGEKAEEKAEEESAEKKEEAADSSSEEEKPSTSQEEKPGKTEEETTKEGNGEKEEETTKEGNGEKEDKKSEEKAGDEKTKDDKKEAAKEKPAAPKIVTMKEDIKVNMEIKDMQDLSKDKLKESKKKLADLLKKDHEKVALMKAKNELEAFIFDSQDKLSQDSHIVCSTEEERNGVTQKLSEASDWLYEQPDDSKKEVFTDKLKEMRALMKDIKMRVYEREERPKALAALKHHLNTTTVFLETVHNMTDKDDPMFTEVELKSLQKLISETTAWRDEALAQQSKIPDHENPTMLVEIIGEKIYALEREMKYLINKAKNYRPKPKVVIKDKDNTTAKANETDSAGAANKTKTVESEQTKDDDDGIVEDEDDTTASTASESQEPAPETIETDTKKDQAPEDTLQKPDTDSESNSEKSSKKKRPKRKVDEEQDKDKTEQLELDGPAVGDDKKEADHTEL